MKSVLFLLCFQYFEPEVMNGHDELLPVITSQKTRLTFEHTRSTRGNSPKNLPGGPKDAVNARGNQLIHIQLDTNWATVDERGSEMTEMSDVIEYDNIEVNAW